MAILIRKKIRVLITAGGTGGHLYPALAVADYLTETGEGNVKIFFAGTPGEFTEEFDKRNIKIVKISGSKVRRYFDLQNFLDVPIFIWSLVQAFVKIFFIMPDAVFSKGGPGSLAVVVAAAWYRVPILIHESDAIPSVTTKASARWAKKIALSFPGAAGYLPEKKTFVSGTPIRFESNLNLIDQKGGKTALGFNPKAPLLLILGGSQGSVRINDMIGESIEDFLSFVQVLHQTGRENITAVQSAQREILRRLPPEIARKYVIYGYLDQAKMATAFQATDVIVARAGAGAISEAAFFGKPAILIPLKESANDHQSANAYEYAKTGAAVVIEEDNFQPHLVKNEIEKILNNETIRENMKRAALAFAKPKAKETIGKEILDMCGVYLP